MKVAVAVTRAYGTNGGYGGKPRETPGGSPIMLRNYPRRRWHTTVTLGDAVPWVIEAARLSRAAALSVLTGTLGRAQTGEPEARARFEALLDSPELEPTAQVWRWWVTISCERDFEVPDDHEFLKFPYVWLDPAQTDRLRDEASSSLGRSMDLIAATIGGSLPNSIDSAPAIDDVFFRAEGRRAFRQLKFIMGTPTVSVSSPLSGVDIPDLAGELKKTKAAEGLQSVAYWWARSIEEKDDWKRFMFQFAGLDILTNKLAERAFRIVRPNLRVQDGPGDGTAVPLSVIAFERMPLAGRFGLVALVLSPETAVDDTAVFTEVAEQRNSLYHGESRAAPLTAEAGSLLTRYVPLALRFAAGGGHEPGKNSRKAFP
jgi:hypothetical protein